MPVPILPILGALSSVASAAWDTYTKVKQLREASVGKKGQDALSTRVEKLEDACLEQARTVSELSKDLEQFAKAMQAEMEEMQRRYTQLKRIIFVTVIVAVFAFAVALFLLTP